MTGATQRFIPRFGMGSISPSGEVTIKMAFVKHDKNESKVDDFIAILIRQDLYKAGNSEVEINGETIDLLIPMFQKHQGTLDFLGWLKEIDDGGGFIVIMTEDVETMTPIQVTLTADLEAKQVLPVT